MDTTTLAYVRAWLETTLTRRLDVKDERGVVAVEWAVAIVVAIGLMAAFAFIVVGKVKSNANNIPDTVQPPE